jgi:hypothetical protein
MMIVQLCRSFKVSFQVLSAIYPYYPLSLQELGRLSSNNTTLQSYSVLEI